MCCVKNKISPARYKSLKGLFVMILLLEIMPAEIFSQQKVTLSGYIRDCKTGEELAGATVYIEDRETGTIANSYGFYSITLPEADYNIRFSYIGYEKKVLTVKLTAGKMLNVELCETPTTIKEVVVTAEEPENGNITSRQMSTENLSIKEIKSLPVLFGEQDILKTIQLLPGVQSAGDGNSGFYVRGGGIDQNLILLDEAPVYNASHLLGFFSVFNSDIIKEVKVMKGGIPANYGGRLSSVVDVSMKNGNMKKYSVSGGVGLINARIAAEGPVVKDKGSFIVAGRRTYTDIFLPLSNDPQVKNSKLYFYDLNAKVNYRINENNRVYLSGYFGRDDFDFYDNFNLNWGNYTGTLRWNHIFNRKLFMNTSFIASNYDYYVGFGGGSDNFAVQSSLKDFNIKADFQYYRKPESTFKFGFSSFYHTFAPGTVISGANGPLPNTDLEKKYAVDNAVYLVHNIDRFERVKFTTGFRITGFSQIGPGNVLIYDDNDVVTDTLTFSKNKIIKTYFGFEPRLIMTVLLSENSSVKASYTRTQQYLHLLSNTTSAKPTDLWIPSSYYVKPEIARQVAAGYYQNFFNNTFETSVELYYKKLRNQIDFKNGAYLLVNTDIETLLTFGEGRAYGVEFFIKKKKGNFTGWISYTWSKSERQFDDINNGAVFPAKQDRRNDISIVANYKAGKNWTVSAVWVYFTGNAATFPGGKYEIEGQPVSLYTERNGYRMPDYHRLDISATWSFKKRKNYESSLVFSIYNVYARENAYSIEFRTNEDNPETSEAVRLTLFKAVPSITYNFKF